MARLDWSRLHSKILRSSIWLEDPIVRLIWICALADSETDGTFYGSYEVLSRAWNLPEKDVAWAMERLCSPDPRSTTKENEGRRIIQEDENSWRVLNKRLYNPSGEPQGASTPRVQKYRYEKRHETEATGNDSNGGNALDKSREEEIRTEKKEGGRERFAPPTLEEIAEYGKEIPGLNAEAFFDFYASKGWRVGSSPMKDWRAAARKWRRKDIEDGKVPKSYPTKDGEGEKRDAEMKAAHAELAQIERDRAEYRLLQASDPAAAEEFRRRLMEEKP